MLECRIRLRRPGFSLKLDTALPDRGVTAIFGPSGCGKTTWLRVIAGLEREAGACIRFRGEVWQNENTFLSPHLRPVGYVFQDAALFPHMSVARNLRYGLRRRQCGPGHSTACAMDFETVVERLSLRPLLARRPETLSGGEAQRVAIGRALLSGPSLLLMDEPLSALDEAARRDILDLLEELCRELDIPVIYVSHAREEVVRLADHLVLMTRGGIRAQGPVSELFARLDIAREQGPGAAAVIAAEIEGHDETWHLTRLRFADGVFLLPRIARPVGTPVRLQVLARDVSLTLQRQQHTSILNIFPAVVTGIEDVGQGGALVGLKVGNTALISAVTRRSVRHLGLRPGIALFAQVKAVALLG
jgi:molybdate transport system ATP-binding protein